MSLVCKRIHYNWRQSGQAGGDWGDDHDIYEVGEMGVIKIINITSNQSIVGSIFDVGFDDGRVVEVHNINMAFYVDDGKLVDGL